VQLEKKKASLTKEEEKMRENSSRQLGERGRGSESGRGSAEKGAEAEEGIAPRTKGGRGAFFEAAKGKGTLGDGP